jgi:outer membrane protein OmpA-like peptidoglycan-associated protein
MSRLSWARIPIRLAVGAGAALALGCASAPSAPPKEKPAPLSAGVARYLDTQKQEIAKISKAKPVVKEDRLLVTFPSEQLFESGLPGLSSGGAERVAALAQVLERYPESDVIVRGYTDSLGSAKANQRLSEERAANVTGALAASGVASSRMKALGFGEQYPVASNDTDDGREKNRRIEIDVVPIQDALRATSGGR